MVQCHEIHVQLARLDILVCPLHVIYLWALLANRWWWESEQRKRTGVSYSYLKASVGIYHVCDYPYYTCLGTFWQCHPYFTHQFYANVFTLVIPSEARSLLGVRLNWHGFPEILKYRYWLWDPHRLSRLLHTLLRGFPTPWQTYNGYIITNGPKLNSSFWTNFTTLANLAFLCHLGHCSLADSHSHLRWYNPFNAVALATLQRLS